ncbi:hypothetical protein CYLTODRAFT_460738 [Cylindrobasidium torrendii FP15055 ss-10]|uniref:Uncharacterized protein n=1 Tax=Cylindrobasidium torrendii FP15055 ss-10 TaxID=1314674 RepID=A0A0D7AQN5_9AGAR|nr:hypothetical protein CYLTODRAFT_460738 [Cylindrobasidium torrendii FP15055 ss-10]
MLPPTSLSALNLAQNCFIEQDGYGIPKFLADIDLHTVTAPVEHAAPDTLGPEELLASSKKKKPKGKKKTAAVLVAESPIAMAHQKICKEHRAEWEELPSEAVGSLRSTGGVGRHRIAIVDALVIEDMERGKNGEDARVSVPFNHNSDLTFCH